MQNSYFDRYKPAFNRQSKIIIEYGTIQVYNLMGLKL